MARLLVIVLLLSACGGSGPLGLPNENDNYIGAGRTACDAINKVAVMREGYALTTPQRNDLMSAGFDAMHALDAWDEEQVPAAVPPDVVAEVSDLASTSIGPSVFPDGILERCETVLARVTAAIAGTSLPAAWRPAPEWIPEPTPSPTPSPTATAVPTPTPILGSANLSFTGRLTGTTKSVIALYCDLPAQVEVVVKLKGRRIALAFHDGKLLYQDSLRRGLSHGYLLRSVPAPASSSDLTAPGLWLEDPLMWGDAEWFGGAVTLKRKVVRLRGAVFKSDANYSTVAKVSGTITCP